MTGVQLTEFAMLAPRMNQRTCPKRSTRRTPTRAHFARPALRAFGLFLGALLLLGAGVACKSPTRADCNDERVVDSDVLAFLSKARALHHEASMLEDEQKLAEAAARLERLVSERRPRDGVQTPEIEEVLADTLARIADYRLQLGELEPARTAATQGLEHAGAPTYFRGHLLEVLGLIEEARSKKWEAAGNAAEAVKARTQAVKLLEESISVQDEVIRARTGKGPKPQ